MASGEEEARHVIFEKPESPVHPHLGWFCCLERMNLMSERMQAGECVIIGYHLDDDPPAFNRTQPLYRLWCLTHRQPDSPAHSKEVGLEALQS